MVVSAAHILSQYSNILSKCIHACVETFPPFLLLYSFEHNHTMTYSRDGDQLCSNAALVLAFLAFCIGIVPQTTCSFLTINPTNITSYPDKYPTEQALADFLYQTVENKKQEIEEMEEEEQESKLEELLPDKRNITESPLTVNLGLWLAGSDEINGVCYPIDSVVKRYGAPDPGKSLAVSRAFGIIASISAFMALILGIRNQHNNDKMRRRNNWGIAVLYGLAALSTWLTFLIVNVGACQGAERTWTVKGPLQGLSLQYGRCICRAGCFLTITAGCLYIAATTCVLTYSG